MSKVWNQPLSGTYDAADVQFLLNQLNEPPFVSLDEKERRIRSGQHYSQMVHRELPPSDEYLRFFHQMMDLHTDRLAAEVVYLADQIRQRRQSPITVVSLARAGTPIGVLLKRTLDRFGVESRHYSISIMRGAAGIDQAALRYILRQDHCPAHGLVFVDGWTAKGAIGRELQKSIAHWNLHNKEQLSDELFVIADVGGTAACAATFDDYAIPSGMLGATVSGLFSRTVINDEIGADDFHGTHYFDELEPYDQSRWFVDRVDAAMSTRNGGSRSADNRKQRFIETQRFIRDVMNEFGVATIHRVKPGIVEGTRVLNRRIPDVVLVKDPSKADVAHMLHLAERRAAKVMVRPNMPYQALCLIKDVQRRES